MTDRANNTKAKTRPILRWWWIGLSIATILWFGSQIIEQRVQQIQAIERFENNTEPKLSNTSPFEACRSVAVTLAIISLLGLGWQIRNRIHRKPGH